MDAQLAYEMMADLGTGRREKITTTDFKENIRAFVPAADIQATRLANISGTEEHRIARKAAPRLQEWNTAYQFLKDDGTAEENLREVNEGLGQTHRGKLQVDDSYKDYTGDESNFRGGYSGRGGRGARGGRRGGRGGGFSGQAVGHQAAKRRVMPVTRERVVKGPSVNRDPPPFGLNVVTKESADIQAAREFQASLGSSSKQSKTHAKGAKGSVHGSQSSQSLTEERSVKPLAKPPRQGPLTQVELASPETFMAIARVRASVPRTAEQPAQQRSTATVQSSTSTIVRPVEAPAPKVKISLPTATQQTTSGKVAVTSPDKVQISLPPRENQIVASTLPIANANLTKANEQPLPDVLRPQSPQQPSIPVLDPMGHLRALEASGLLSKELTDMLNNAVRTSFHAQAATKPTTESSPKIKTSNDAVVLNEPSRPATYTQTELKALRPKAESNSPPNVSFTAPQTSDTTQEAKKLTNPFAARTVPLQSTGPAENSRGLAQRLADQRKALIGEHIHRTRFQPPVQFLIEGFEKLSLHDYTNTESATEISDTTSTKRSKTTENPFGSPKPRGSGPELPYHLRNIVPAADHGAAVRRQYGIPDFTTPASKTQTNTIAVPKASETSPQPHRRSQAVAETSPTARPPASNKPKPSLPAFLRGQTAGDAGAAARAQYGGKAQAPFMSNATPSLTVSKEDNSAKSRPQLPAHLRGQTAGDPGAAVRAQYSNVPAPVTNSLKASSTVPRQEPLSPTKPRRGSKVNTSGFIGLAQAARNSIKEEDDPIKIASSKGY